VTLFVDASAIVAMIGKEPEARIFAARVNWEPDSLTSVVALWESVRAVARVRAVDISEARALVLDFLRDASIRLVSIDIPDGELAIEAHRRYGKGEHEASLNMGDCFAYACASRYGAEILFKGNDFIHTDLIDATLG
jgi:ribonuclease VapC